VAGKLKLSLVLPTVQVVITAILTQWADRVDWILLGGKRAPGRFAHLHLLAIEARIIWRSINAPAFMSTRLALLLPPYRVVGFGLDDLLYLAAVAVLWYFVGRLLDRRRSSIAQTGNEITTGKATAFVFLMALGGFLLLTSLWTMQNELSFAQSYFLRIDAFIVATLFLLWAMVLLIFPGWRLARRLRSKHVKTDGTV